MRFVINMVFICSVVLFAASPGVGLSTTAEVMLFAVAAVAGCMSVLAVLHGASRTLRNLEEDARNGRLHIENPC